MRVPKFRNLWQLYIVPLLLVGLLILGDKTEIFLKSHTSFESLADETSAFVEIDPNELEKTTVTEAVDGDTIVIENDKKVRFIGVDTPETKHPSKPVQCFGKEASRITKALLEGKEIYLEKDISEVDRYDRLLRYIYLPNPKNEKEALFVNEYLLEQGYARIVTYPPDVKYLDVFQNALQIAYKEKRGLWKSCVE